MIDREKVVRGLERCLKCSTSPISSAEELKAYIDCEYTIGLYCGKDRLLFETLELLKEQETSNTGKARIFQCEKCGYGFDDIFLTDEHNYDIEPNYCPNCGRSVKWE